MRKDERQTAIDAIKKKLVGKSLSYNEIFAIMDEISNKRLGPVLTTYFAAAGFKEGFNDEELYFLTKAMVATGPRLHFDGIVADKHSTGGVAGTRTTMILVPIIAACGFRIPKNSSRAITSPAGTADTMEVVAPVTFTPRQIEQIVHKVGGCVVWGGHLGLAPADDVIIQIEQPLAFESFDKIIVSIMAKKVASAATHVVLDIPVGPTMKIQHFKDADVIAGKFTYLAGRFHIKVAVDINETRQNAGRGIGPVLEARDVFEVLEQAPDRPLALEAKALRLSGRLLSLCLADSNASKQADGEEMAREAIVSGRALEKMREIIKAQGGNPHVRAKDLEPARYKSEVKALKSGRVCRIDNQQITVVCRILGCPTDKRAGMYLNRKLEDKVDKNDILCTVYSSDRWRLREAEDTIKNIPVYTVE
ncbi:thymidine phosphorylase [Patescibacteria group bacterium]|nr:thymidine phosphorylase [Patescibacteria group bacterium]MBU1472340.1 thymidine phosphorylase [Patescibacteria group bacterium]MBU2460408.1 thymidine phosphorylase [Patescibacteria group bacterium]MBU2544211.1 thymidine phosphorylase [Patescibacteria group bacterium]